MRNVFFLFGILSFSFSICAAESDRLETYYSKSVPDAGNFVKRLFKDGKAEPWPNLGVRSLIDQTYVLAMANVDLPEGKRPSPDSTTLLLRLAEEMQDKDPESRTFGNFRWYWRTPEVTDWNAVEFVASHALPVWFEAKDKLPEEARTILERMLRRCVDGCIRHRVRPDYTNISIYNFVHLMLLGQAFDRPDAVKEGEKRLQAFLFGLWDHGVFEYVSPTYYAVDVDALQLGLHYVKDESARKTFRKLLDLFWTDMALNWYVPAQKLSGAQSRTYNYLYGTADITRLFDMAGLAPKDSGAKGVTWLNTFHGPYTPPKEILSLTERYPRLIEQRWGAAPGQWRTSYVLKDIALGTAAAAYAHARQNMVLTVDLADFDAVPEKPAKPRPRCYFIADGREDPYGTKRYPTSNAGHEKALHMEAIWLGAQRTVDALGLTVYSPVTLNDPVLTNIQSHFVFRKPDAILVDGKPVALTENTPLEVADKPVVLRYGNRALGIRVPWTRDCSGKAPKAYLIDDADKNDVYRLTIDHLPKGKAISYDGVEAVPGAAFWLRIGSSLDGGGKFEAWSKAFVEARVEQLDVRGDDVSIRIAGTDGPVALTGTDLAEKAYGIETTPPRPKGILMLDGVELGRPILEQIPVVGDFVKRKAAVKPVAIQASGTYWEAESGFSIDADLVETNDKASGGKAVRVNDEVYWPLDVKESGEYYLWARVFAIDPQHDSFRIYWSKGDREPNRADGGDWHIGSGKQWRWIQLKLNDGNAVVPVKLDSGPGRLTLRPREQDGQVDRLFLTTDPTAKPE